MSMSKKDFIALAAAIRAYQNLPNEGLPLMNVFTDNQIKMLADFCASQNPRFMRDRWLAYIAGECGPNGGAVKKPKTLEGKVNARMRKLADAVSHIS